MRKIQKLVDAVGIDFGTTNSSVAFAAPNAPIRFANFSTGAAELLSYRSVLYFELLESTGGPKKTRSLSGPEAITAYLEADEKGRLIQSLKSHLPSQMLTSTEVFGRRHKLEDLIARIDAVDAEKVQTMAQRLFDPERIAVTLLGRLNGIKLSRSNLVC